MRLLAVDTATEICGVALSLDDHIEAQVVLDHGGTHTRHVMAAIDRVMDQAGVDLSAIDAFAVTQGPGSFTGLRIGISTVKGLAVATAKPMVGVSTLAVLAHQAEGRDEFICPIIDARRNELYWTLYRPTQTGLKSCLPETVGPAAYIPSQIHAPCTFIGNGISLYRQHLEEAMACQTYWATSEQGRIQPSVVAELARKRLADGEKDDVMTFGPVYLRKSDAEIGREKRLKSSNDGGSPQGAA